MPSNRWVDASWWRDWMFYAAALVATVVLLAQLGPDRSWWRYPFAWLVYFTVAAAVLGFFREVVRAFRGTAPDRKADG